MQFSILLTGRTTLHKNVQTEGTMARPRWCKILNLNLLHHELYEFRVPHYFFSILESLLFFIQRQLLVFISLGLDAQQHDVFSTRPETTDGNSGESDKGIFVLHPFHIRPLFSRRPNVSAQSCFRKATDFEPNENESRDVSASFRHAFSTHFSCR